MWPRSSGVSATAVEIAESLISKRLPEIMALVQITNTSRQSLLRSAGSGSKHCVPDCRCSSILNAETSQFELSLPNAVQQIDAGDRDRCIAEPLETEHHRNALLHAPMVLLDKVIQIFR